MNPEEPVDTGTALEWSKRIGADYSERVERLNQTRCQLCFRLHQQENGSPHICDKRRAKLAEVIMAAVESSTPDLTRGDQLWALGKVADSLLSKYLTKRTQHRQNSSKSKKKHTTHQ